MIVGVIHTEMLMPKRHLWVRVRPRWDMRQKTHVCSKYVDGVMEAASHTARQQLDDLNTTTSAAPTERDPSTETIVLSSQQVRNISQTAFGFTSRQR